MADFKRILFPVDFSPSCEDVAPHVLAMAEHFRSHITLLNIFDFPTARNIGLDPLLLFPVEEISQLKHRQQQTLETFARDHFSFPNVDTVLEEGEPASVITEFVNRNATDLVMMPTRGAGPFRRFLIGSVTAKVLHDCDCPVWTSVHREERTRARPITGGPVLCAVNLEPESVELLRWSASFAAAWSTPLRVLHVEPAADEKSTNRGEVAVREYHFEKARDRWGEFRAAAGVDGELILAGGDIARAVAATAENERASVVTISRGKIQKPLGGLRTQAYMIIRESPCPVITI